MTILEPVPWIGYATLSGEEEEAVARLGLDVRNHPGLWETAKVEAAATDDAELRLLPYWPRVRTIFIELLAIR